MNKIAVIGGGMVGSLIFDELSKRHHTELFDIKNNDLGISYHQFDVLNEPLDVLADFDMLVLAIPGSVAFRALQRLALLSKPIVDISFFPEDARQLEQLFKNNGSVLYYDCGVAPGFDNIALAHYNQKAKVHRFKCMVGGLPLEPKEPFKYKAPFSPSDVIEEYVRPARFRRNAKDISLPALSEVETLHHAKYGELEAFNSDGLRSLLDSFPEIPDMVEKTIRYRGHAQQMLFLREAGFFSTEKKQGIAPLDLSSELLFKAWKLGKAEAEFTLMLIEIGWNNKKQISIELSSERDPGSWSSMTKTTGYTCTAAVEWLLKKSEYSVGVYPPEKLGLIKGFWDYLVGYLSSRNILISITER